MTNAADFTGPSTELLQALIRNECVNDGTPDSGNETRNSDLLVSYLEGTGVDIQTYTPRPGRDSMIARIAGSDPNAPSL
ncbi:MAG: peptidase M20 family protein, partial [Ilumatobacter sp.]|nr:peptidase M20 family protein [Ilumatobacter sp.]